MSEQPFDDSVCEVERYELRESKPYAFQADRREFVRSLGAGIMVAVAAPHARGQRGDGRTARRDEQLAERFHIGEDGMVTVMTSKVEVGQGSRTQLSQAVAEELALSLDRVRLIMADTELCPDDGGTAGSRTTPSTVPRVRNAAAALRGVLVNLAAAQLDVPAAELRFAGGIFETTSGKQLPLQQLANHPGLVAKLQLAPPADGIELTPVARWQVLGTDAKKVGGREVVTGTAVFPSDIVRPGMLYGKVLRPPAFGATLMSVDLAPAKSMPGVTVVHDGDFVGVVAATSWQAGQARDAVATTAQWQRADVAPPSSAELFEHLKQTADVGRARANSWGNGHDVLSTASKTISARYEVAYIQHAPMEPRAAVAEWSAGKLTVWTGTQQPARVHGQLAESFRLANDRVRVIVPDTGGGFGGKHSGEAAIEAARLAKAAGRPVHLRWTREEEFTWAYFRPAGLIEVEAGIDASARLIGWDFANYNSGSSAIDTPYTVPHGRTRFLATDAPLRQGSYRALASTANTFARECAMDELAELAQVDPLEFRLRHLEEGRLKNVLQAAAKQFAWTRRRGTSGSSRGVGLACGTEKGSYAAACAEVEVVGDEIRVLRVIQAFECGAIQNPANLRRQVEGCLVMGLGGALYESVAFQQGRVLNPSFSAYRVPRMRDVPEIEIVLVDRQDLPSVGGSETPIIAIAPAVANAVHQAIGARCRSLPLRIS